MSTTLRPTRPARQSGALYPRLHELHVSCLAEGVAKELGCTVLTAQKYLCAGTLEAKLAVMLRVLIDAGDRETLDRILRPIDAALAGIKPEQLTRTLRCTAQQLDLTEDQAEATYNADESRENLRRWQLARLKVRAIDRQVDAAIAEALVLS
jgi:hypothetical protein